MCASMSKSVWRHAQICMEAYNHLHGGIYQPLWRHGHISMEAWSHLYGGMATFAWIHGNMCVDALQHLRICLVTWSTLILFLNIHVAKFMYVK